MTSNNITGKLLDRPLWATNISEPEEVLTRGEVKSKYANGFTLVNANSYYGTVFKGEASAVKSFVTELTKRMKNYMITKEYNYLMSGKVKRAAVKVIHKPPRLTWPQFIKAVERESVIQTYVHETFPSITPACLFAGVDHAHGVGIIVSQWLELTPVNLKEIGKTVYRQLEGHFSKLWSLGVLHMDAHANNIFTENRTGGVVLLDWGASAFLPKDTLPLMKQELRKTGGANLPQVWDNFTAAVKQKMRVDVEPRVRKQQELNAKVSPRHKKENADWVVLKKLREKVLEKENNRKKTVKEQKSTRRRKIFRDIDFSKSQGWTVRKFAPDSYWIKQRRVDTSAKQPPKANNKQNNKQDKQGNKQQQRDEFNVGVNVRSAPSILTQRSQKSR